jgi:hypothetical protein
MYSGTLVPPRAPSKSLFCHAERSAASLHSRWKAIFLRYPVCSHGTKQVVLPTLTEPWRYRQGSVNVTGPSRVSLYVTKRHKELDHGPAEAVEHRAPSTGRHPGPAPRVVNTSHGRSSWASLCVPCFVSNAASTRWRSGLSSTRHHWWPRANQHVGGCPVKRPSAARYGIWMCRTSHSTLPSWLARRCRHPAPQHQPWCRVRP